MKRGVRVVLVLLAIAVVSLYVTLLTGHVTGVEFSAETFRRREFSYWQIPLLEIQVAPMRRTIVVGNLENYLFGQGYITQTQPDRWQLSEARAIGGLINPLGPSILIQYLDAVDDTRALFWESWSEQHAPLAAVLWPDIQLAARRDLYPSIPALMSLARQAAANQQPPSWLRENLSAELAAYCERLAGCLQSSGQASRAATLQKWACEYRARVQPAGN